MHNIWRGRLPQIGATLCALLAYSGLVQVHSTYGSLRDGQVVETLAWLGLAFVAYGVAALWAEGQTQPPWLWIWGPAIVFRLLLLATPPTLSDDIYRYLWDGHLSNQGISPYAYAIESPALNAYTIPARELANHGWMASPYLPVAQWLFALVTRFLPPLPVTFQTVMLLLDLSTALLLTRLLDLAGLPRRRVLLYLWNPLAVVESAHGAHVDVWMALLTLAALWLELTAWPGRKAGRLQSALERLRPLLAVGCLALATLTKILPAMLLPILIWRWGWARLLLYELLLIALLLPAARAAGWGLLGPQDGVGLFGAIRIYADKWSFNSGLFFWLEERLGTARAIGSAAQVDSAATWWAKRVVAGSMALLLVGVGLRARALNHPRSLLRLMALPWLAYILLTPTVHPWYLLAPLTFVPFLTPGVGEPRRLWWWALPWLYLSGALFLSYLTYQNPLGLRELIWVRQVEWLPTWGLLIWAGWMNRKGQ